MSSANGATAPSDGTDVFSGSEAPRPREDWLGVELRHLAAIAAISHEGSFRAAAQKLGYVQSSISQQVAQLERLVGVRLVERSRGGGPVTLTEAGERLLEHSEDILTRFRAAQADLVALAEVGTSTVRLGLYQSVATRIMPRVLPAFSRAWPQAIVQTTEAATDAPLFTLVRDGTIDLAFAELPVEPGPFGFRRLLRDPFVLAVAAGSPLTRLGRPPTWHEIAQLSLVGHKTGRYLARVEAQMRAQGAEPRYVYRSDINATVQSMVGFMGGAAVLTRLIADPEDSRTELIDLSHLLAPRIVALIWHRDRHLGGAVSGFRDVVLELCGRTSGGTGGAQVGVDGTPRTIAGDIADQAAS